MFYILDPSALHRLGIVSVGSMRWSPGSFSDSLKIVPRGDEHLLAASSSLCGPTHPKPSQCGLGRVIVEAKSSVFLLQ